MGSLCETAQTADSFSFSVMDHRSGDNFRDPVLEQVGRHSIMSFILIGPEETAIISDSHQRPHPKISFDFYSARIQHLAQCHLNLYLTLVVFKCNDEHS